MARESELNVVLLPPKEIRDAAIDMSRKLSESFATEFTLGQNRIPHITVYQARYPEKNLESIEYNLNVIAKKTSPFELPLSKFSTFKGYVFWDSDFTNEFSFLNKSVVYQLNPLRDGLVLEHLRNFSGSMGERFDIQNYGSLIVGRSLSPHVTISKTVREADALRAFQELRPRIVRFNVTSIFLARLGPFGTVTEILREYPFGGQGAYNVNSRNYF